MLALFGNRTVLAEFLVTTAEPTRSLAAYQDFPEVHHDAAETRLLRKQEMLGVSQIRQLPTC